MSPGPGVAGGLAHVVSLYSQALAFFLGLGRTQYVFNNVFDNNECICLKGGQLHDE